MFDKMINTFDTANKKLQAFIKNIEIVNLQLTDKQFLMELNDRENEDLVLLMDIVSRIKYSLFITDNPDSIYLTTSNNCELINSTLSDTGKIYINYITGNITKKDIFFQFLEYNKFSKIFKTLFIGGILETNGKLEDVEEITYSFKQNCELKACAGNKAKSSSTKGYIIGDDTGFTSKLLTSKNLLSHVSNGAISSSFPGVISKRIGSSYGIELLKSSPNISPTELLIFSKLLDSVSAVTELTIDGYNCLVVLTLLALLFPEQEDTGVISTHLCAINSFSGSKTFSIGSVTGKINSKQIIVETIQNSIGYNSIVSTINKKCIDEQSTTLFYANEINNARALVKMLINILDDFYLQL